MTKRERHAWMPRFPWVLLSPMIGFFSGTAVGAFHGLCAILDLCELKTSQQSIVLAHDQCQGTWVEGSLLSPFADAHMLAVQSLADGLHMPLLFEICFEPV